MLRSRLDWSVTDVFKIGDFLPIDIQSFHIHVLDTLSISVKYCKVLHHDKVVHSLVNSGCKTRSVGKENVEIDHGNHPKNRPSTHSSGADGILNTRLHYIGQYLKNEAQCVQHPYALSFRFDEMYFNSSSFQEAHTL